MSKTTAARNNDPATTPGTASTSSPESRHDEHAGKGGMYELVDGKRVLVARTEEQTPPPTAKKAA